MGMDYYTNFYQNIADSLIRNEAYTATKYISEKHVIRATRRVYNRKIDQKRNIEIMFIEGRPNFHSRRFIRKCIKAGESFPVQKIQLTWFPKRRKK
jgi:uncharacterized Fe-S cluster-containing MiaB family protein